MDGRKVEARVELFFFRKEMKSTQLSAILKRQDTFRILSGCTVAMYFLEKLVVIRCEYNLSIFEKKHLGIFVPCRLFANRSMLLQVINRAK